VRAANAIGVAMSTITTMAFGAIGGTMDTRVPAARSLYASIRDGGLTNFGRLVCGAFLIPTNVEGMTEPRGKLSRLDVVLPMGDDPSAPITSAQFMSLAWRIATDKRAS